MKGFACCRLNCVRRPVGRAWRPIFAIAPFLAAFQPRGPFRLLHPLSSRQGNVAALGPIPLSLQSLWCPVQCSAVYLFPQSSSPVSMLDEPHLRSLWPGKMLELFSSRISVDQDLSVIVAEIDNDDDVKQRLVSIVFHASVTQQRSSGSKIRISCSHVHERTNSCPPLQTRVREKGSHTN